jgi:hypothetical protein
VVVLLRVVLALVCDRHDAKITGGSYANMDD